ncbi:MAG TPA: hypothetical protein VMS17_21075 [Gemmataceae bacterium]|nr:hypothetical protein [Gemmataceae bacterium]
MRPDGDWTPKQWFEAAEHCQLYEHQGCPCCHGRHCVFRSDWGGRVEYYCTACDFSASHDRQTGRFFTTAASGREQPTAVLHPPALSLEESTEGV